MLAREKGLNKTTMHRLSRCTHAALRNDAIMQYMHRFSKCALAALRNNATR